MHSMTALWTSDEIAKAVGGTASADFAVGGVSFDSREVGSGDLFLALKGELSDGHRFLDGAFGNGAAGAIVSEPTKHPHILVDDTTAALEQLGVAARARVDATIIGVTGSVGKTGTKEALFAALERSSPGKVHRSVKSYNNHVGVPLSLSRMPRDARYGVFEMGMNHEGELSALTRFVRPHIALITTVGPAHIEHFENESGIADAKAEIFEGLIEGGTAIIPADNFHYPRLRAKAELHAGRVVSFGFAEHADVRCLDHVPLADGGSLVTAKLGDAMLCYAISQPGDHWISNSLAVLAAVEAAGADIAAAGLALADLGGLKGRGARHRILLSTGEASLIDESYNANPVSMRATLAELAKASGARRVAILGSMKELGLESPAFHSALKAPLEAADVSYTLLVGEEMDALAKALTADVAWTGKFAHCASTADAAKRLPAILQPEDIILVKGSNSMGLSALVDALVSGGI
jgi:UDP-N-acetylmuramoyl-tripeptide--D-alanyl-D-alanine ligase